MYVDYEYDLVYVCANLIFSLYLGSTRYEMFYLKVPELRLPRRRTPCDRSRGLGFVRRSLSTGPRDDGAAVSRAALEERVGVLV